MAPLSAVRLEKRRGSDEELIVPPALHQYPKMLEDFQRTRSWTRILPKRVEGTIDTEKIIPPALNPRRKMEKARSLTRVLPKSVEARDQCQVLPQRTEGKRDQDNGISPVLDPVETISPVLDPVETLEKTSSNEEKSFTRVLPKRVEEARDTCQDSKESSSDHRDEADDRLEALVSDSRDENDENVFGRPTTHTRENSGSLLTDLVPLRWLYNEGSRATDKVDSDAIEIVLLLWTTNILKVKIVDGRNEQMAMHSSYFEHDEMQEINPVSSKPRGEEPPPALIPANTSNSIADYTSESEEESDESALRSFFCGMFCHEKGIDEMESSSTLGPEDIPLEISYHYHHHHRHHHHQVHSSKTNGVLSNDLPTATSMVVSDVSSNSTDASDWSSECTSVSSRPEPTFKPETQACQLVNRRMRPVKQGKWKKFFSMLHSR
jgi:hypothetical protein